MSVIDYKNSCTWFIHDTDSNTFLLQQRDSAYAPYPNMWGFPGGTKDGSEPPRETSYRELEEELRYKPKNMEEVITIYHHSRSIAEHFYYIKLDMPKDKIELHEGKQLKFFKLEEMKKMKLAWWSSEVLPLLERHVNELGY